MKTSGLPCRATHDCDSVYAVPRQDSMESLREAALRRDAHELEVHGYRHVIPVQPAVIPFSQSGGRGRRPKRSEDLSAV